MRVARRAVVFATSSTAAPPVCALPFHHFSALKRGESEGHLPALQRISSHPKAMLLGRVATELRPRPSPQVSRNDIQQTLYDHWIKMTVLFVHFQDRRKGNRYWSNQISL